MSAKKFAVLEALMRAAPATLSTEDLLQQVWDENADPFTKTVQVTLARLRRNSENPTPSRPSAASDIASPTDSARGCATANLKRSGHRTAVTP